MRGSGGGARPDKNLFAFLKLKLVVQRFSVFVPRVLQLASIEQLLQFRAPLRRGERFHTVHTFSQFFQLTAKFEGWTKITDKVPSAQNENEANYRYWRDQLLGACCTP
ncbi:hypothetical protein D3C84_1046330 [compost metagenome]